MAHSGFFFALYINKGFTFGSQTGILAFCYCYCCFRCLYVFFSHNYSQCIIDVFMRSLKHRERCVIDTFILRDAYRRGKMRLSVNTCRK